MISTISNAFKSREIRNKIFFTLFVLIVYRLGCYITVPGVNAHALQAVASSGLVNVMNIFSGGGLTNYSLFAMGVSPFVTAQIVVQLLQMDIVPRFVEWSKQGDVGRRKLNQATRYLTIVLAFVQSIGITAGFNVLASMHLIKTPNAQTFIMIGILLTAGTMFATWLGDMITQRGLGNGVSMIIFAGIIARTPVGVRQLWQENVTDASKGQMWQGILFIVAVLVLVIVIIVAVTWVQQAERRIPIQYTRRATTSGSGSYLPLKVNVAGVIPVIFASSLISTPQSILLAFQKSHGADNWYQVMSRIFNMQTTEGAILYTVLIVLFTFFYAFVQVNPEKLSENLQKQGSYIPSVWPGKDTQSYVSHLLMRLSTVGSLFLGLVALVPLLASDIWGLDESIGLGGTSLLIVVGVAIDIIRQLDGLMMKRQYVGFIQDDALEAHETEKQED
ncbi:MAG: preprotein translocase subunit SecY [Furfurilactobacillus sp.]|uniref:Protein translocase subunit SecY n=1 Tax=Furfurilactobacillus milii TaxID=2888272 RepID=A0ABT6D993_9LACO|nr:MULTISPECIES: preprotein translocase subunit SecY [Furfurilactobacillus]MCF6160828.1 preprotein translocase subunit SecY [Furfurilactobacillus milii]MCF6162978.1 preprotein translocase subunit SecY [Furfurilactobacillus milii]MCF6165277.1 preprotein translocase subunit SecY [Furfurilactobacillus rossiae]MCF6419687.1 preprotein translocase subunit SecY [Furfurilactobacillus milii]MCH4012591.1 preprotein translocase subunit SecY [Furfurilactobacillus sp.]